MTSINIELFGEKLKLSQRSVRDIIDASLFDNDKSKIEDKLFLNAFIIHSALKINLEKYNNIRWYNFILKSRKKKLEKLIAVQNIMASVGFIEMNEICEKIYELDFGSTNGKKKVESRQTLES